MQYNRRQGGGGYMDAQMMMDDSRMLLWDATRLLNDSIGLRDPMRVIEVIAQMEQVLDRTRNAYNDILAERDAVRDKLVDAESKLTEVQRAVQRYTVVQEPVVASDGFTYEHSIIKQYLDECTQSDAQAHSQQTREPLTNVLIPNQSLKKLVELLKTVTPQDVPPATVRPRLGPLNGDASAPTSATTNNGQQQSVDWTGEVDEAPAEEGAKAGQRSAPSSTPGSPESAPAAAPKAAEETNAWRRPNPSVAAATSASSKAGKPITAAAATVPTRVVAKSPHSSSDSGAPASTASSTATATPSTAPATTAANNNNNKLHPCLRVYGFCNFKDDCQFAMYPFEACLNNIKGKCRFGATCKELHVVPNDPKYINPKTNHSNNSQQGAQYHQTSSPTASPSSKPAAAPAK